MMDDLYLGIDIGTGGVRTMAVDATGCVVAQTGVGLNLPPDAARGNRHEQLPEVWLAALTDALGQLSDFDVLGRLVAVCIDGTSGTVVAVDSKGNAVRPAMMYNDTRSTAEAQRATEISGRPFSPSYALPKILWLEANEPDVFARTTKFISQSDYIAGQLTGRFDVTDYSNALKSGVDLDTETWPSWMTCLPGMRDRLPEVVAPTTVTGYVTRGSLLPEGLPVIAGCTDGTASFLASGAARIGDYNTTLGTTLVFKGLSETHRTDPDGLIYCHKLPNGVWLPGAAGSVGGEWIAAQFAGADPTVLDATAEKCLPCDAISYPLVGRGERFPFRSADAESFCEPPAEGDDLFAANLQGTAFVERLAYDVLDRILQVSDGQVYATGGGSRSDVWMQCRADVTGRVLHRPDCPEGAFGSAILAAVGSAAYDDLRSAMAAMVRVERTFEPRGRFYDDHYDRFLNHLRTKGYL